MPEGYPEREGCTRSSCIGCNLPGNIISNPYYILPHPPFPTSLVVSAIAGIPRTENLFTPEVSIGKTIRFTINSKRPATVEIYDITGRTVRKYDNVKPGTYEISSIPQGVYFVRVKTKERTDRFKVTILR